MSKPRYIHPSAMSRPTIVHYTFGLVVSKTIDFFFKKNSLIPLAIDDYILDYEIAKTNGNHEYSVGVYTRAGKRYFIKTWHGRVKDYSYYALKNESIVADVLAQRIKISLPETRLRVPEFIHAYKLEHMFSVVFEYVDGASLDNSSEGQQRQVVERVIDSLQAVSDTLTNEDKNRIPTQKQIHYLLLLSLYAVIVFIKNPLNLHLLLRLYTKAITSLALLSRKPVVLAHRDVVPSNIISTAQYDYLLDCETVVLTFPYYDKSMQLAEGLQKLSETSPWSSEIIFYRIYIPLQMAVLEHDTRYLYPLAGLGY